MFCDAFLLIRWGWLRSVAIPVLRFALSWSILVRLHGQVLQRGWYHLLGHTGCNFCGHMSLHAVSEFQPQSIVCIEQKCWSGMDGVCFYRRFKMTSDMIRFFFLLRWNQWLISISGRDSTSWYHSSGVHLSECCLLAGLLDNSGLIYSVLIVQDNISTLFLLLTEMKSCETESFRLSARISKEGPSRGLIVEHRPSGQSENGPQSRTPFTPPHSSPAILAVICSTCCRPPVSLWLPSGDNGRLAV